MSFRKIFSGLKKKSRHRLAGGKHEPEGMGADVGGQSVDSMGSLPRPEHRVIGKGEHGRPQSKNRAKADAGRIDSKDPALYSNDSGPVPVGVGQHDIRERKAVIEGKEVGRLYLGLIWAWVLSTRWKVDPVKGGMVSAGRGLTNMTRSHPALRWNLRVCKLPAVPLYSSDHSSDDVGDSAPDHIKQVLSTNENGPGDPDENISNWKSTASATAKFFLRGVRESADAFGPLKSVAGGLCFILENCEVQPSSCTCYPQYLLVSSGQRQISRR